MSRFTEECPGCFGEGIHDMRDSDAYVSEHWTDEEIARAKSRGFRHPIGVVVCDVCCGTGVVTPEKKRMVLEDAFKTMNEAMTNLREQGLLE